MLTSEYKRLEVRGLLLEQLHMWKLPKDPQEKPLGSFSLAWSRSATSPYPSSCKGSQYRCYQIAASA